MERFSLANMIELVTRGQSGDFFDVLADPTTKYDPLPQLACSYCDGLWPPSQMHNDDLCKVCARHLARKHARAREHAEYLRIHPEGKPVNTYRDIP